MTGATRFLTVALFYTLPQRLDHVRRTTFTARAQIVYKFRRNTSACSWEFWRAK